MQVYEYLAVIWEYGEDKEVADGEIIGEGKLVARNCDAAKTQATCRISIGLTAGDAKNLEVLVRPFCE